MAATGHEAQWGNGGCEQPTLAKKVGFLLRANHLPYLDFSTLEKREAACRAEIVLNRRLAPDLCRLSLGTTDFHEASIVLANWVVATRTPTERPPKKS